MYKVELKENPFKIGDILHHSWGYEQTNADFYQVVGLTPKAVKLQQITSKTSEYSPMAMSGHSVPVKDDFVTPIKPMIKRFYGWQWHDEDIIEYHVNVKYGSCSLWDGKPVSCSWYA